MNPLDRRRDAEAAERYSQNHYLLFGGDASLIYEHLDSAGVASYLRDAGFSSGSLTQARMRKNHHLRYMGYRDPDAICCDFCGKTMMGVEYEKLKDGRERCPECSSMVIRDKKSLEALFRQTREGLCLKYGIDITPHIKVRVVSQAKLSRMQGNRFVPTKYFDPRTVGLAVNRNGRYEMYLENGAPKGPFIATAAHELTHIWQYEHWDWDQMKRRYGELFLAVCEGMAKWSEIQYLYLLNEGEFADRLLENEVARTDVYGYGLRLYLNQYRMSKGVALRDPSPFSDFHCPLEIE